MGKEVANHPGPGCLSALDSLGREEAEGYPLRDRRRAEAGSNAVSNPDR